MKKFFNNEKIFLWFNIICFAVGGTIPLVTISLYNYMSVDDFAKGVKFRSIYTNPSLLDAFVFAFEQIRTSWERWQGVYTVNFFSVFNPAFFMEELAFLTPIIMLIVLIISTSIFLGTMLRTINADRVHIAIIVTLFLFLQLQTMPSMVETIFWYSGAVAYTVSLAFFYIFFAMVIKRNNCKKSITIHDFGLILLAFLLGGTQFTIVLESLIIYFIYFVFTIKQYTFPKCAVLASLLLGGGLNIFAPGNLVRRDANGNGMGPIEAILESFKWAANASIEWISPMFIFVILLMIPIIWCIVRKTKN